MVSQQFASSGPSSATVSSRPTAAASPEEDSEPEPEIIIDAPEESLSEEGELSDPGESEPAVCQPPPSSFQSRAHSTQPPSSQPSCTDSGEEPTFEMSYRETMSALRHTMKWQIPDTEGDVVAPNLPWIKKSKTSRKLAIHLPVDESLCDKMTELQVSLSQGTTSSRTSEPVPLGRNQFLKGPSRQRWYQMYQPPATNNPSDTAVKWWSQETQRLNATFNRLCKPGSSAAPSSLAPSQENLRKWEKQHRDQSVIINHTTGIVRGQSTMKGKLDSLFKTLTEELCTS